MANYIRLEEVKKHTSSDSVWFVIHDAVYDVTSFLEEHPGGADALLESAGQDSTQAFEDVGHSEVARLDMKKYKVGDLHPDDKTKKCCPKEKMLKIAGAVLLHVLLGVLIGYAVRRYRG